MGIFNKSGSVQINGKSYKGNDIQIVDGQVIIDGSVQTIGSAGVVEVKVEGNIVNLASDSSVTVHGDVMGSVKAGNNVVVNGDVLNNVDAGNNITAEVIKGNADAGNNINMDTRRNWF